MDLTTWVNNLNPSAAQFWGAVVGVGGGLAAILIGALVNADLNRRRDDQLRDKEARAVAAAIRGELAGIRLSVGDLLPIWKDGEEMYQEGNKAKVSLPGATSAPVDASEYARLPPFAATIFEANASRLGLLGSQLAGAITVIYTNYRVRSEVFKEPMELMLRDMPDHFAQQINWGRKFCKDCESIERFLVEFENTGKSASLAAEIQQERQRKC